MTFDEIMARVPEVAWTMPEERPDHQALATTNEYAIDRLHKAAEIVWLWVCGDTGRENDELVPEQWFEQTVRLLQRALDFGEQHFYDPDTIPFWVYWRALEIMNIPKIEASSSAARERTERFG